ncbi:hypothetical protein EJ04DRAFT_548599 [Polyplosphaeria fusca]|uniref:DUF6590 domain-containing protein n=1 Tax=Polyplosphaeria fusca TaxID=682080 RepID=A0A9P4R6R3_9PLEO|nr:hypothetical protein EJ04DRAFT_548599 [Polyplosphaeria fusca]
MWRRLFKQQGVLFALCVPACSCEAKAPRWFQGSGRFPLLTNYSPVLSMQHSSLASDNPPSDGLVKSIDEEVKLCEIPTTIRSDPRGDERLHPTSPTHQLSSIAQTEAKLPRRYDVDLDGNTYTIVTEIVGTLQGHQEVKKPRHYFKRGRVFAVVWYEPAGSPESERAMEVYVKIRRFVVIRQRANAAVCLAIHTYRGQGTKKAGVLFNDHCALVAAGDEAQIQAGEELSTNPLYVKVEDPGIAIDPMSRVNIGSIHSIQHGQKVKNIGRLLADSLRQMEEYFMESLKF